jgi:hypothetical protein
VIITINTGDNARKDYKAWETVSHEQEVEVIYEAKEIGKGD